ncbi:hypothetical protein ABE096_18635 [Robertmurraya massiliosenegalensis]
MTSGQLKAGYGLDQNGFINWVEEPPRERETVSEPCENFIHEAQL